MTRVASGQLSIFDTGESRRPCEYSFQRYIGQSVKFWRSGITGKVVEIAPYYTYIQTEHGEMVGIPQRIADGSSTKSVRFTAYQAHMKKRFVLMRSRRRTMKTYKDWICRYYSDHEDGEPDGEIIRELIWCRDCKYNSNTKGNYVDCDIIPQMFGKTPDDNYCSWAERKDDEID